MSGPIVSADGHILEPIDLFVRRLPKHLRESAIWEEDFETEPVGEEGTTLFRTFHGPWYDGHTYSRYIHSDGSPNTGKPERIIEDLDHEGIFAQFMHPNMTRWGAFSDDHEASIAHARVYNDWVTETFGSYQARLIATYPVPMSDVDDAVSEIERVAALGARAVLLPAISPLPYYSRELDRVWAALQANHLVVAFHIATGGVKVKEPPVGSSGFMMEGTTPQTESELEGSEISDRMLSASARMPVLPQQILMSLIGGGVPERFADLQFVLVEFGASWLVNAMAAMDKCWTIGVGQNRDWWVGKWYQDRAATDQPGMTQLFHLNDRWPYPLRPSDYVRRQFHISFQEDPLAVACRHLTGVSTIVWGCDYPHAEGTFMHSQEAIEYQFRGVEEAERDAILGGTLAGLLGLEAVAGR